MVSRKLRMGMVGGGPGAFIGEVHRKAARLDGMIEVVGGAFDIVPEKSKAMGRQLNLDPARVHGSFQEMLDSESRRSAADRFDFVSVCTPNNTHFPIAKDLLGAGFHVVCEKPMTMNVEEALKLEKIVGETGRTFALMHNYTGYPMVKLARDMVSQGDLGAIRRIVVRYSQDWLATALEETGNQQASWRTNPEQAGAAGCMGDIGTHAENLAEYITGLRIEEVCADLTTFVPGRRLDDDGNCLVRWQKGVKGLVYASQISTGEENGLAIKVYGTRGGLEWQQENPNHLVFMRPGAPAEIWRRGNPYVAAKSPAAGRATRLPPGHPEAFIEAFANIYRNFAETVLAREEGREPDALALDYPGASDGLRGMRFIEAVVESSRQGAKWVRV